MKHYRHRMLLARIIPLLLITALLACSPPQAPQLEQATLLPSAKPIDGFNLINDKGEAFTLESLKGRWTFAFFGYTHCPDVCPTSLAMLSQAMRKLKDSARLESMPQGVFVSVDPERDTPETLAKYVTYFYPDFVGVTGAPAEILALTRQLGIFYARAEGENKNDYLINHSTGIVLFDPDAKFHALFNAPRNPARIASEFLLIRDYYEATR